MRYQLVPIVPVCVAAMGVPGIIITKAFATDYPPVAEAQKIMSPGAVGFEPVPLTLSADQPRQLVERTGGPVRSGAWRA